MKINKVLSLSILAVSLWACGGGQQNTESTNSETSAATESVATPDVEEPKGKQLIAQSDCLGCHKEQQKLVGPSYADVAAKYEATPENITMLAGKIINGGQGNWGEVPMSAHPQVSQADAEEMVKYILTIKK
ncbi:c-type cytochrome [Pedobacter glucosidilyticus]|uniref:c-type cytochrome n=1 Tax=Pedobacter glucosidilyticus TaxID=1122941 RepID=UPI00041B1E9A|nr:c-type cytochrome [Pedobacter glucosidilyticus]